MPYPKMLRLCQEFDRPKVENLPAAIRSALEKLDLGKTIRLHHALPPIPIVFVAAEKTGTRSAG